VNLIILFGNAEKGEKSSEGPQDVSSTQQETAKFFVLLREMTWNLPQDWEQELSTELKKTYFASLFNFVENEYATHVCYPPHDDIFKSFSLCPYNKVKVVLLGQDPYHEPQQAQGLAFSVASGTKVPPSLRNIFKELADDLPMAAPRSSDLSSWARQGVLLLNATLTVREHEANSHAHHGWETFTDAVIQMLSKNKQHLVFLLWGNYAQQKATLIDETRHLVLRSAHPSPLSAYHGFFGNHHFSRTNIYLTENGLSPINW
jgi:uracil-DNA glycosylase